MKYGNKLPDFIQADFIKGELVVFSDSTDDRGVYEITVEA